MTRNHLMQSVCLSNANAPGWIKRLLAPATRFEREKDAAAAALERA